MKKLEVSPEFYQVVLDQGYTQEWIEQQLAEILRDEIDREFAKEKGMTLEEFEASQRERIIEALMKPTNNLMKPDNKK